MNKKLVKYYQENRYAEELVEARDRDYFPNRLKGILDKQELTLNNKTILDHGCGDGGLAKIIKQKYPGAKLYGTDISKNGIKNAKKYCKDAIVCDLNKKLSFADNKFDVIFAIEIIEHLTDPDTFLVECKRVLKKGGYLVITTPNLLSWYQRILALLGVIPTFYELSTVNRQFGLGFMKKIIINDQPVGHIHVFNKSGLYDITEYYGFKKIKIYGNPILHDMPIYIKIPFNFFENVFSKIPSFSSDLILIAQK